MRFCCDCVAVLAQLNPARPPLLSIFLERPEDLHRSGLSTLRKAGISKALTEQL